MKQYKIKSVIAREILDSRGNPTIETKLELSNGKVGVAAVPSGASTGKYEAHELRDNDKDRYLGKGVLKAINNVNTIILDAVLKHKKTFNQLTLDNFLITLDGTDNKRMLGANAILSVSLAFAKAAAKSSEKHLFEYISAVKNNLLLLSKEDNENIFSPKLSERHNVLPTPMFNIVNGGAHAGNSVDIQEFMIMPTGFETFTESLRAGAEIFHSLKKILANKNLSTSVGDEGGFAPNINTAEEVLDLIIKATTKAGYKPGEQVFIALDVAAADWMQDDGRYHFPKQNIYKTTDEMVEYFESLANNYPIISIEDPLGEDDHEGWAKLTKKLGEKVQIVGDDLFVTNTGRIKFGIENKTANSVLIKPNQIGTLTETLNAINLAQSNGLTTVISHRSGETEDTTIADLAVATNAGQIKTGSISRSDRIAKYNRLLEIEQQLANNPLFVGDKVFYQLSDF